MFTSLDMSKKVTIRVADDRCIVGEGVGTCVIKLTDQYGETHDELLHNCVYSPSFATNLISTRRLWKDSRISSHFAGKNCLKCKHTGRKYYFEFTQKDGYRIEPRACIALSSQVDPHTLHSRFNHSSSRRINKLLSRSSGLQLDPSHTRSEHDPSTCPACQQGKAKRKPFPKRVNNKFTYFGERISSDICGPFPKSIDGYKYALVFIDSATNHAVIYLTKDKSSESVRHCFTEYTPPRQNVGNIL